MTENLIQKMEERVGLLLSELTLLRSEIKHLRYENASLKAEKANSTKKIEGIISALDALDIPHQPFILNDPEVLQGTNEYVNA